MINYCRENPLQNQNEGTVIDKGMFQIVVAMRNPPADITSGVWVI